jgi:hypothetical protein
VETAGRAHFDDAKSGGSRSVDAIDVGTRRGGVNGLPPDGWLR